MVKQWLEIFRIFSAPLSKGSTFVTVSLYTVGTPWVLHQQLPTLTIALRGPKGTNKWYQQQQLAYEAALSFAQPKKLKTAQTPETGPF